MGFPLEQGAFSLLEEAGNGCALHFFFSCKRKRERGAAFVTKAAPFSLVLYVLRSGSLVLGGLVLPLAPLTLTSAGRVRFLLFGTGSICFQILQQHELNIICDRPVLLRRQFADFVQHILRQTQCEHPLACSHPASPFHCSFDNQRIAFRLLRMLGVIPQINADDLTDIGRCGTL